MSGDTGPLLVRETAIKLERRGDLCNCQNPGCAGIVLHVIIDGLSPAPAWATNLPPAARRIVEAVAVWGGASPANTVRPRSGLRGFVYLALQECGYTQTEIAAMFGIDRSTVSGSIKSKRRRLGLMDTGRLMLHVRGELPVGERMPAHG